MVPAAQAGPQQLGVAGSRPRRIQKALRDTPRVIWIDGLRGIAAMQVVLFHYASAFLPAIATAGPTLAHYTWEQAFISTPLGFLFDGSSAVYLFFIISGVALTYAFSANPFGLLPAMMRRLVRLGLPMAAATVLAAGLFSLLPDAQLIAAERTGSIWFSQVGPRGLAAYAVLHQIAFEGMLTGFKTSSLLPGWAVQRLALAPQNQAFDAPLWTLHVEFYGSMLILLLVSVRASGNRWIYRLTCAILGLAELVTLSPLSLFIAGHLAANVSRRIEQTRSHTIAGWMSLISGVLLCSSGKIGVLSALSDLLSQFRPALPDEWEIQQKMIGACLIFGGLALLPILQRPLEHPVARWFGKISFSLYLVHFPLLFSCVAAGFNLLIGALPYGASVALVGVAGIAASIAAAAGFERWVDRPSIRFSRTTGGQRRRPLTTVETAP